MDTTRRQELADYLKKLFGRPIKDRAVRSITANPPFHGLPTVHIEVGQFCSGMEPETPVEQVLAIFESESYLVVTPTRGNGEGLPYIFPRSTIVDVKYED